MIIVYKPTDDEGVRKSIAAKIGMCPVDLDVEEIRVRWLSSIDLPTDEIHVPSVGARPKTLWIRFVR